MYDAIELATASAMARNDLYFFSRWMFKNRRGYNWLKNKHHEVICDALQKVYAGEIKRLIINVPPRYSKTELVINFIAWALGKSPDSEFILTSYASPLAVNNSWVAREMVQHEAYARIFSNIHLRDDSNAKGDWRTVQGGVVYATGAGGTITGYGAGKHREGFGGALIIDDPLKPNEAHSDTIRNGVNDWFVNTLESRKNDPQNTPIILIMQRLHEHDLSGWLLDGGNGEEWYHICLPALCESEDDPLGREIGEALWPEKHTAEMLLTMQSKASYVFSGQYQQRPAPLGGGIIKGIWFARYSIAPIFKWRKIFADTAQKTKEHNDYSVFQCWGMAENGRIYLIDQVRGKWEAPELERTAVDFWNKHKADNNGSLREMMIEDKASGTGLIQTIKRKGGIPIKAIERSTDKLTRAMDGVSYIESGYVYLPDNQPWVSDFVGECEAFTPDNTHAHDDQIDPMMDAIKDMLQGSNGITIDPNILMQI